jgi:hypothetical protein
MFGEVPMSFDTLTIVGIFAALLSGGFLIALVSRNDAGRRYANQVMGDSRTSPAESQS